MRFKESSPVISNPDIILNQSCSWEILHAIEDMDFSWWCTVQYGQNDMIRTPIKRFLKTDLEFACMLRVYVLFILEPIDIYVHTPSQLPRKLYLISDQNGLKPFSKPKWRKNHTNFFLRACLHGVGGPGLVGLASFVFTLWRTQNKRNLPHQTGVPHSM